MRLTEKNEMRSEVKPIININLPSSLPRQQNSIPSQPSYVEPSGSLKNQLLHSGIEKSRFHEMGFPDNRSAKGLPNSKTGNRGDFGGCVQAGAFDVGPK